MEGRVDTEEGGERMSTKPFIVKIKEINLTLLNLSHVFDQHREGGGDNSQDNCS